MLVAAYTNDTKIIFPHFFCLPAGRLGKERMEWEPQFHLSSASAFRSVAALRHDDTSRIKTTLLSSQKNSSVFVRQKAKLRKSRTQKVGKSESEVQSRRSTCPVSNPDNLCASHLLARPFSKLFSIYMLSSLWHPAIQ